MIDLIEHQWTKTPKSQAHKAHKSPSEQGSKNGLRGLQLSPISTTLKARSKGTNQLLALFCAHQSPNVLLSIPPLRAKVRAKHLYANSQTNFSYLSLRRVVLYVCTTLSFVSMLLNE
jgi:hypothetical protein